MKDPNKPPLLALIFGRRMKDASGCITLIWRGASWERNPGGRWERAE